MNEYEELLAYTKELEKEVRTKCNLPPNSNNESDDEEDPFKQLDMMISALEPIKGKKDKPEIKLNMPLISITLRLDELKDKYGSFIYQDKVVNQIYMVGHFLNTKKQLLECKMDDKRIMAATRLIFEFQDGAQQILKFKDEYVDQAWQRNNAYTPLVLLGGIPEEAFSDYGYFQEKNWLTQTLSYNEKERQFYDKLHPKIAPLLVERIRANPKHLEQAKKEGVCVVSLGCGDGKDMAACREALSKAGFDYSGIGVDYNPFLLEENRKKNPKDIFIEANIKTIGETFNRLSHDDTIKIGKKLLVFIALGLFTRSSFKGSYEALKVFQQLEMGNVLIMSGWESLLITKYSATSAGWNTNFSNHCFGMGWLPGDYRLIGVCERQFADEELGNTLAKSRARAKNSDRFSILDLSLTQNPLERCSNFLKKYPDLAQQVTQIDLSWSQMSEEDINSLLSLIPQFPKITHITTFRHDPWAKYFEKELEKLISINSSLSSLKLIVRMDSTCEHEISPLTVPLCRMLGIYETMPNDLVLPKTPADVNNQSKEEVKPSTSVSKDVTEQNGEQADRSVVTIHSNPSTLMPPPLNRPAEPGVTAKDQSLDSPSCN